LEAEVGVAGAWIAWRCVVVWWLVLLVLGGEVSA